jgi:hypothetical protein
MPLPSTLTPIATQTLTSAAATVTFSNIPQTYTDLVIVSSLQGSRAIYGADLNTRYNGDSGTNYSVTRLQGDGSTASSARFTNETAINNAGSIGGDGSGIYTPNTIHIFNYSNTSVYKTSLCRNSHPTVVVQAFVGLWRSTAAITSIAFTGNGYNFNSGSTFTIYGVKAA